MSVSSSQSNRPGLGTLSLSTLLSPRISAFGAAKTPAETPDGPMPRLSVAPPTSTRDATSSAGTGGAAFDMSKALAEGDERKRAAIEEAERNLETIEAALRNGATWIPESVHNTAISAVFAARNADSAVRIASSESAPAFQRTRRIFEQDSAPRSTELGKLTLADSTTEGANLVSIQSRRDMTYEGIANQSQTSLLSLFV